MTYRTLHFALFWLAVAALCSCSRPSETKEALCHAESIMEEHPDSAFIYNNLGQIRYVLSPQYQHSGFKSVFGYEYRYDSKGRLVKKLLPGCSPVQYWYSDGSSRVSYSQDGVMASKGIYRYYIYDRAKRLVEQGSCSSIDGSYAGKTVELKNFYDNYSFIDSIGGNIAQNIPLSIETEEAQGLQTGVSKTLSDGTVLHEIYRYDGFERTVETFTFYPGDKMRHTEVSYTYDDKVSSETTSFPDMDISFQSSNTYFSNSGLPKKQDIKSGWRHLYYPAKNIRTIEYDGLGHPVLYTRRNTPDSTAMSYDINGHLTMFKGPGYESVLNYAGSDGNPGTPRYNGFISSMKWKGPGDEYVRVYTYDYGFRSYDPSLTTWTSMDPLCEQYPNLSPYVYCVGNPVNYVDHDGRDALRIVDEDEKTIKITATYYVLTEKREYREENGNGIKSIPGYKLSDMTSYNDYLNGLNLIVKEGPYNGYSIKFDLSFEAVDCPGGAASKASAAITEDGYSYGNSINRANEFTDGKHKDRFRITYDENGVSRVTGGITIDHKNIIMNYGYDSYMNILHEIFHTFGLSHPEGGAEDGVFHYPPERPNTLDAYNISTTPLMPTIHKNKVKK